MRPYPHYSHIMGDNIHHNGGHHSPLHPTECSLEPKQMRNERVIIEENTNRVRWDYLRQQREPVTPGCFRLSSLILGFPKALFRLLFRQIPTFLTFIWSGSLLCTSNSEWTSTYQRQWVFRNLTFHMPMHKNASDS